MKPKRTFACKNPRANTARRRRGAFVMTSPCCPVGSLPYLAATHEATGRIVDLGAVELYANTSSTGTAGILICPDVRLGHMFPANVLTSAKRPMS